MATPESQYGQRKFIYWYEEAWSYIGLFGGVNDSPGSIIQATGLLFLTILFMLLFLFNVRKLATTNCVCWI